MKIYALKKVCKPEIIRKQKKIRILKPKNALFFLIIYYRKFSKIKWIISVNDCWNSVSYFTPLFQNENSLWIHDVYKQESKFRLPVRL